MLNGLIKLLILTPPILLALVIHEVAHGWVAWVLGDPTPKAAGRLSPNPLRHLDPLGTVVFFITAWMGSGIGWAKPVPVNPGFFRSPRRGMMWVSAAGPAANFLAAVALALVFRALIELGLFRHYATWKDMLAAMLEVGVYVNLVLGMFNLLPIPPLDGSGIVAGLLPEQAAASYRALGRYGLVVVLALIVLPGWVPGLPDLVGLVVVGPARAISGWLLPV